MYQDINNKTGHKNMQGTAFLYGNLKLLTADELAAALGDGIAEIADPVKPPKTDDALRSQRYNENNSVAISYVEAAKANPEAGTVYDPMTEGDGRAKKKADRNRINRANKKTGITDNDDFMADYNDQVYDAQDSADDAVENMTRAELDDYVASDWVYPVGVAP